jgi:hypothetical protein
MRVLSADRTALLDLPQQMLSVCAVVLGASATPTATV